MHYADIRTSERLQRVLRYLYSQFDATGMDIITCAGVASLTAAISELRENGYNIKCRVIGKGYSRVAIYKLMNKAKAKRFLDKINK